MEYELTSMDHENEKENSPTREPWDIFFDTVFENVIFVYFGSKNIIFEENRNSMKITFLKTVSSEKTKRSNSYYTT